MLLEISAGEILGFSASSDLGVQIWGPGRGPGEFPGEFPGNFPGKSRISGTPPWDPPWGPPGTPPGTPPWGPPLGPPPGPQKGPFLGVSQALEGLLGLGNAPIYPPKKAPFWDPRRGVLGGVLGAHFGVPGPATLARVFGHFGVPRAF